MRPHKTVLRPTNRLDPVNPEDDAAIYYTSGTTGKPKGAVHTHKSLLAEINLPNRDLSPEDVALCVMPFFHVGGTAAYQFGVFKSGATSVILEKFDEGDVVQVYGKRKNNLCKHGACDDHKDAGSPDFKNMTSAI